MKVLKLFSILLILVFALSLIFLSFQNPRSQETTEIKKENLNGITEKLTSLDLSVNLIEKFSAEENPLILPTSNINSIEGASNIQIEKIENYLKFSSAGEGGFEISTKDNKKYNFLITQNDFVTLNSESGKILEGSFSPLPFKASSDYPFENGKAKIKTGAKIEYSSENSELKIKFIGFTILKQDNLESFNIDISLEQIPLGGIYPINAELKTLGISNLEYLGSSYEIPDGSLTKIVYGKLILPDYSKVKSVSPFSENSFGSISKIFGIENLNKNKMISFEGKNIDLGNGLVAEIPEGTSVNFDKNGNMLLGHTRGKEVKFNNNIDLRVSGAEGKTEGVYIFTALNDAKSSGVDNYLVFGENEFNANLKNLDKSGQIDAIFNQDNPYIQTGEKGYFHIAGEKSQNAVSSNINIKKGDAGSLPVVDNEGFRILNDGTSSRTSFGFEGKREGIVVGKYSPGKGKEPVPMLVRDNLDKEIDNTKLQIASLYSDKAEKIYFTSNIGTRKNVEDIYALKYENNFVPKFDREIPFMQDVFEKDVRVTMDTVNFIESDVGKDFPDYKRGYKITKAKQNEYNDDYFREYVSLAGGDEKKASETYNEAKRIVNDPKLSFSKRNDDLKALYKKQFGKEDFPTLKTTDPKFIDSITDMATFYYKAEIKGYLPPESSAFSLGPIEKKEVDKLILKGIPIKEAIKKVIKIGPNVMFSDPYIPAQNWWGMK